MTRDLCVFNWLTKAASIILLLTRRTLSATMLQTNMHARTPVNTRHSSETGVGEPSGRPFVVWVACVAS